MEENIMVVIAEALKKYEESGIVCASLWGKGIEIFNAVLDAIQKRSGKTMVEIVLEDVDWEPKSLQGIYSFFSMDRVQDKGYRDSGGHKNYEVVKRILKETGLKEGEHVTIRSFVEAVRSSQNGR